MDVYNSLISRRSVRRFLPKEVDQSKIKKILEGAAFAPSGHNIQPWHVYVVCLLYTSPSPRDKRQSRMPSSA